MITNYSLKKIFYCTLAVLVFVAIRWFYVDTTINQLFFILKPTAGLIEIFTAQTAEFSPVSGFYFTQYNIVIDASCSGIHFLSLVFLLISASTICFQKTTEKLALIIPFALVLSYFLTIFISAIRILLSIAGQHVADYFLPIRPHLVLHEAIGVFVHLIFLIGIFYFIKNHFKHTPTHAKST